MQTVITLLEAAAPDLLDRCLAVRQEVFTREMGVPADVERDSRDCLDGECRHFLITRDGRDIGAVRCLPQEDGTLRLQRFCIRKDCRGQGAGRQTLAAVESRFRAEGLSAVALDAKCSARGFYEACGYEAVSGEFRKPVCPMWQCAGHCDCFSQKRACPPCAGERALFLLLCRRFSPPEPGKKPPQTGEDTAQYRSGKGSCRIDEYVPEVAVPSGHRELMPFIGEGKARRQHHCQQSGDRRGKLPAQQGIEEQPQQEILAEMRQFAQEVFRASPPGQQGIEPGEFGFDQTQYPPGQTRREGTALG